MRFLFVVFCFVVFILGVHFLVLAALKKVKTVSVTHNTSISQDVGIEIERNDDTNANVPGLRHYMELRKVTDSQGRPEGAEATATSPYLEMNEYAPLHPATRSWEVSRENVVIEKLIGQGAFGQVAQGKAAEIQGREGTIKVAIKMLKGNTLHCNRLSSELTGIGCKYRIERDFDSEFFIYFFFKKKSGRHSVNLEWTNTLFL